MVSDRSTHENEATGAAEPAHGVTTMAALEALYATPLSHSIAKEIRFVSDPYRELLASCPFAALATAGPEGLDCSPRGDGPGFIHVLDETTLAIPDRRGNNRLDTLRNIVRDGRIALLCMIPGWNETFRVNGRAHVSADPALLDVLAVRHIRPTTAIVIAIETMYFQCARAVKRAQLWQPETWCDPATLPTAGTLTKAAISEFDAQSYDAALQERQARTMY